MNANSHICKFIADHPADWRKLLDNKGILVKDEGNYSIFNYVVNADFNDPIVQESRGIIIDTASLEVVCFPFRKFGNYGEYYADEIDWTTARVQEKVDGSIVKLWFDKARNDWRWSTNGMIDASMAKMDGGMSFQDLIDIADNKKDIEFDCCLEKDCTYIFELVSPFQRIVIDYPNTHLYHIGSRNNVTGEEFVCFTGVASIPKEYPIHTLSDCLNAAEHLNDGYTNEVKAEGFVVVDANWHRVKIKSPAYLLMHHVVTNKIITKKDAISMLLDGLVDWEEISVCPEATVCMKWYDYQLSLAMYRANAIIAYARNLYAEYSYNKKSVVPILKKKALWHIGFWGIDHPDGTAMDYYTKLPKNRSELYDAIQTFQPISF